MAFKLKKFNLTQVVSVHLVSGKIVSVKLKLDDSLSEIRKQLANKNEIKMDDGVFFGSKDGLISSEEESTFNLRDIVIKEGSEKTYHLYLRNSNKLHPIKISVNLILENNVSIKVDSLFEIRKELLNQNEIKMDEKLFYLGEDGIRDESTFNIRDITGPEKTYNLYIWKLKLGYGYKGRETTSSIAKKRAFTMKFYPDNYKDVIFCTLVENTSSNDFSLEFEKYLEPTKEFINEVKDVEISKQVGKIIENFGLFIPTKIIISGKISKEGLLYQNYINTFELLTSIPKFTNLREKLFTSIGKRKIYSGIETCEFTLSKSRSPRINEFKKIPTNILKYMENEKADFSIFATILDEKNRKNDFFNCQIVCTQGGMPNYIVYCYRVDLKPYECKLKIKYMIIGNYTDFNSIKYDELSSDIRFDVKKIDFSTKFCKNSLHIKSNSSDHFFGIPVLKDLKHLNQQHVIIGHHFYTDLDNIVGVFIFPFNLDKSENCWEEDPDQRPFVEKVFKTLNQLKLDLDKENELSTDQEIIQKLKLNHGLFLDDDTMKPSKEAIYNVNGELDINVYDGQPIIYTNINEPNNNFKPLFQQYDTCINFPFAEITFKGNLLETFLNCKNEDGKLNESYGHFFSENVFVGGQLFIKNFNTLTQTQIHHLKMHISWAYNLAKYEENQLYDFINLQLESKIETSDGNEITTTEKLVNWMKNMYQENMIDIISYISPIPVSKLQYNEASTQLTSDFNEKVIKVSNYKERLNLEVWIKDSIYVNLPGWINNFNLLQGLRINKNYELEIAKKVAIDLIQYPCLELENSFDLKLKPTNQFEIFLFSNKISSIKKGNLHIFNNSISMMINDELKIYEDNLDDFHFINYKQYEIILHWNDIILSEELKQDIEKGIKDMKPYKVLQDVFNEYGHLFPQKIILGKSFKFTSTKFSPKEFSKMSTIDSVKSYLKTFDLLTQKGDKIDDLSDFIQDDKDLEIIEYDDVITLYDILQVKLQKHINVMFEDEYKIIMVGIDDLKDLSDNNIEHYKRISLNPSLNHQNYEVFGSIISNEQTMTKSKEFSVKFRLKDFKGFTAIIKNLETPISKITKITEFHILWMIIGKPSKLPELSVFSPKNREFQIIFIDESILLQPDKFYYEVNTPFQLSEGYMISINAYHPPINDEPANIVEFIKWSCNSIIFRSDSILKALSMNENEVGIEYEDNLLIENFSIELHICILFSETKKLRIDNKEDEYPFDLIGNVFTNENFIEYSLNTEIGMVSMDIVNENNDLDVIVEKIISYLLNEKNFTFDENKKIQVILDNYITNN
ncbi:7585_t:CDS:2, partial [Funneliformis mosseae]